MKKTKGVDLKLVIENVPHSPGPWTFDSWSMRIHPLTGASVATMHPHELVDANASLIAHAPEMFEMICELSLQLNEKGSVQPLALKATKLLNEIVCTKVRVTK